MHLHTNHLINETSPYLLQHAHNPVNWYPWNEEALKKAKEENKPILVSIGYAACHWCHVMERESFEDEDTAAIMNEHFINIKIDREERPDLDHIYMDAVQAMTGSGGWPLNVFLTPDTKPFYGGTYFPPRHAFNRPSWQEVLSGVRQAFHERRHEIDAQAENLIAHLEQSNAFGLQKSDDNELFIKEKTALIFQNIMKSADKEWGGFGNAPKFPQTFTIQYLLRYYHVTNDKPALDQALLSLDKMIEGGIYDQLGGGFARYSTDKEWLAPHFEKMLYDNALLISLISEAYQLTGKQRYKEVIDETIGFIQREMLHSSKGFYAALDADSEGVEGKFYVWEHNQVMEILGSDGNVFCEFFDVTEKGNWEEKNILRVKEPLEEFAIRKKIPVSDFKNLLDKCRMKLLQVRDQRVRPALDDKVILGWNALMNTACSKAFAATGREEYRQLAIDNMQFLFGNFVSESDVDFFHTWKNGVAKYPAFLDDYAFLIQALLQLQEITGDVNWIIKAKEIAELVVKNFIEAGTGFFYYTGLGQEDVVVRKKEVYDGAVPSGNSIMAYNLYHLSILFDRGEWREQSEGMVNALGQAITKYPTSFGNWAALFQEMIVGTDEIAVMGVNNGEISQEILSKYLPHKVLMSSDTMKNELPLLTGKPVTEPPSIYLCRNYTCQAPVKSISSLMSLINNPLKT